MSSEVEQEAGLIVTVDEIAYRMKVDDPSCGFFHYHDEPHFDGSPGQPNHHHHDAKCERRTALLTPVYPKLPPWSPEVEEGTPAMYRIHRDGEQKLYATHAELPDEFQSPRET